MGDIAVSFGSVFFAEMGDKSQLVVVTLAARAQLARLVVVLAVTIAILQTIAVTAGAAVGALLPGSVLATLAGLMFIAFGIWTWRSSMDGDEHDGDASDLMTQHSLLAVGAAFFVAELGDKTMLTTAGLAADRGVVAVWIGSWFAMVAAVAAAVVAGRTLLRRLRPQTLRRVSASVFVALGLVTIGAGWMR